MEDVGIAKSRSRRSRDGKTSRFQALKQVREARARGEKMDFIDYEEKKVYDEVDEDEYSKIVQGRLEDDWIVNDEGDEDGYVDDGREIFDEADEDDARPQAPVKGKNKRNANIRKPGQAEETEEAGNSAAKQRQFMSQFLANKSDSSRKRKKEENATLAGDDNLDDLLKELKSDTPSTPIEFPVFEGKKKKKKKKKQQVQPSPMPSVSVTPVGRGERPAAPPANPFGSAQASRRSKSRPFLDSVRPEPAAAPPAAPPAAGLDSPPTSPAAGQAPEAEEPAADGDEKQLDLSDINFDEPIASKPAAAEEAEEERKDPGGGWAAASWSSQSAPSAPAVAASINCDLLPTVAVAEGQRVFRFFWLDAYEDMKTHPGVVYLFGRTRVDGAGKATASCCVRVKDIRRRLFFLPRREKVNMKTGEGTGEDVTLDDVRSEVTAIMKEKYKIFQFKCQPVSKRYAFELRDVPAEAEYLEVVYHPSKGQLPPNLRGRTFSRVFGTRTSSLEQLILDRRLKGPAWLDISGAQPIRPPLSWCKFEVDVADLDQISKATGDGLASPPLTILVLSIKTVSNSKDFQNEIISVGGLVHNEFFIDKPAPAKLFQSHFTIITHPGDRVLPFDLKERLAGWGAPYNAVHVESGERALLGRLLSRFHLLDPDIIIGHDLHSFELDVLTQRLASLKVPHWHRIGRLKRGVAPPKIGGAMRGAWLERTAFAGRVVCDSLVSAKELIRARSYDLGHLVREVLRCERPAPPADLRALFSKSEQVRALIDLTMNDASFVLRLVNELQVLPLANQITGVCGNLLTRTLVGGRAERNEYLLLHAFTERNFLPPDKLSLAEQQRLAKEDKEFAAPAHPDGAAEEETGEEKKGRKKPAYAGGLVLEPKKGFYDKFILLLDFNSLYPSIIQEYNICFTTVDRQSVRTMEAQGSDEINLPELPSPTLAAGILPTEIRKLVESRREVKKLMKAPDLSHEVRTQYDIRQKALKITANSMYGCLGFSHSRFYAKPLAALTTYKGREILMKTKELVEGMNLDVIYGDTDSIMVNTNSTDYDHVLRLGGRVKAEVNKLYRLLELDIDGVFKSMLLLKKKKYAALTVTRGAGGQLETQQELKGLDIVRRDWCRLAVEVGEFVVREILSGRAQEAILESVHARLEEVGRGVRDGSLPLERFLITKTLARNPEDYADARGQAHVQVALRHNSRAAGRPLRSGDTVEYAICRSRDGADPGLSAAQRAYSPEEVRAQDALAIDEHYYLAHQLHPVVSRLLEPMEDTGAARVAECLGLDPTQYHRRAAAEAVDANANDESEAMLGDSASWADCEPLSLACPACAKSIALTEPPAASPWACPHCRGAVAQPGNAAALTNQLTAQIKARIATYYRRWLTCEDSGCGFRSRRLPSRFKRGHPVCPQCATNLLRPEYSDSRLYRQLSFYRRLFEVKASREKLFTPDEMALYAQLCANVSSFLAHSAFAVVDLTKLFGAVVAVHQRSVRRSL